MSAFMSDERRPHPLAPEKRHSGQVTPGAYFKIKTRRSVYVKGARPFALTESRSHHRANCKRAFRQEN
jgi:hypothetical protein